MFDYITFREQTFHTYLLRDRLHKFNLP